ncbi:MAG TPA: carboxymuconolactone decarboxylase family protein [Aldersonia sp.]
MPDSIALDAAHRTLFDAGMAVRREVVGDAYVDAAAQRTAGTDAETLQQYMCEIVWGSVWTRPGLDRRSRSLVNLGILVAQGH